MPDDFTRQWGTLGSERVRYTYYAIQRKEVTNLKAMTVKQSGVQIKRSRAIINLLVFEKDQVKLHKVESCVDTNPKLGAILSLSRQHLFPRQMHPQKSTKTIKKMPLMSKNAYN